MNEKSIFFVKNKISDDYPPQLLKNIITVGANINQGEDFKRNVQDAFLRAKNRVYYVYFVDMEPYQNKYELNLCELIIHCMNDRHFLVGFCCFASCFCFCVAWLHFLDFTNF